VTGWKACNLDLTMCNKCRATIEKLRKDNDSLKEELFLENKFSVTPTDNIAAHRISAMQDEADALTRQVTSQACLLTRPLPNKIKLCNRLSFSCVHTVYLYPLSINMAPPQLFSVARQQLG
jgi:hypothetical protein